MPEVPVPYSDTNVYLSFSLEEVEFVKESRLKKILAETNNRFFQSPLENAVLIDELVLLAMHKAQDVSFNLKPNFYTLSPYEKKNAHSIPDLLQFQKLRLDTLTENIKEPQVIIFSTIFWFNDMLRLFGKFAWNFDKSGFFSILDRITRDSDSSSLNDFASFISDFFEEKLMPSKIVLLGYGENLIEEFTSEKDFKNWISQVANRSPFKSDTVNSLIISLGGYPFDLLPSYYIIGVANELLANFPDKIIGVLSFWNGIHEEIILLSRVESSNFVANEWNWLKLNLYFLNKGRKGSTNSRFFTSVPQVLMSRLIPCRTFYSSKLFLDSIRRGAGFKMKASIYKDILLT